MTNIKRTIVLFLIIVTIIFTETAYLGDDEDVSTKVRKLRAIINQSTDDKEKLEAFKDLSELNNFSALLVIMDSYFFQSKELKEEIVNLVAKFDNSDCREYIIENCRPPANKEVRKLSIEVIKKNRWQDAVKRLMRNLNDRDPEIRILSYEALGALGDENTIEIIKEGLKRNDWRDRESAIKSLLLFNNKTAFKSVLLFNEMHDFTLDWLKNTLLSEKLVEKPELLDIISGLTDEYIYLDDSAKLSLARFLCYVSNYLNLNDNFVKLVEKFLKTKNNEIRFSGLNIILNSINWDKERFWDSLKEIFQNDSDIRNRCIAGKIISDKITKEELEKDDWRLKNFLFQHTGENTDEVQDENIILQVQEKRRDEIFSRYENSAKIRKAIEDGLEWLVLNQEVDGRWSCRNHNPYAVETEFPGFTSEVNYFDSACTGLALLCFTGNGITHRSGKYKEQASMALKYLLDCQDSEGCFNYHKNHKHNTECLKLGSDHSNIVRRYNHNISLLALVELYALSRDPDLVKPIEKALNHARNDRIPKYKWSFYFEPEDIGTSVFYIMALRICKELGFNEVDNDIKDAIQYIQRITKLESGRIWHLDEIPICFGGYDSTATGIVCRLSLNSINPPNINELALKFILPHKPVWNAHFFVTGTRETKIKGDEIKAEKEQVIVEDPINFFYWYFATIAFSSEDNVDAKNWLNSVVKVLLEHQRKEGFSKGSWDPECVWGKVGGRVYTTTFGILTLQGLYKYRFKK